MPSHPSMCLKFSVGVILIKGRHCEHRDFYGKRILNSSLLNGPAGAETFLLAPVLINLLYWIIEGDSHELLCSVFLKWAKMGTSLPRANHSFLPVQDFENPLF